MNETPAIVRVLGVLRRRWWVIALSAAVCVAAALAFSLSATKQYAATAKLLFRESNLPAAVGGAPVTPSVDPEGDKSTNILLVTTNVVAERVRERLDLDDSAEALLSSVEVKQAENGNLVEITATDTDPARAKQVADGFATEYVAYAKRTARAQIQEGRALVRDQLGRLPRGPGSETERRELRDALQRLVVLEAVQTGNAEVIDLATLPSAAASPTPRRDALLALVVGLALGVGLAFFLETLDRRVSDIEEFERLYGLPTLAGVPDLPTRPKTDRERAAALEPFRILRNSLPGLTGGVEPRVVVVTSAVAGEGKSTIASGIARATALSGRRVALVEADMRRPTMADRLELRGNTRGLTTALIGGTEVSELLRRPLPALDTFSVLPSGPLPPNAAELLRSAEFGRVLRELLEDVDLVVFDAPPLLPVADSQVLLDRGDVDAAIVVARAGYTQREHARRARTILDKRRVTAVGLVINALNDRNTPYDYYDPREAGASGTRERSGFPV